jgi:hypothetical protein
MARVMRRSKATPRVKDGKVQRKNYRDMKREPGPLEIQVEVPGPGYRHVVTRELLERFLELVPDWSEISRGLELVVLTDGSTRYDGRYENGVVELTAWPDPVAISVTPVYHAMHRAIWDRLGVPNRPTLEFIATVPSFEFPDAAEREIAAWLHTSEFEIVEAEAEDEWLAVERDEVPGTILAELTQIEDAIHIYERAVFMRFDRCTAAAYQLLHVFLHELGHHIDAMALPARGVCMRGENYAEQWAIRSAELIWDDALALLRR